MVTVILFAISRNGAAALLCKLYEVTRSRSLSWLRPKRGFTHTNRISTPDPLFSFLRPQSKFQDMIVKGFLGNLETEASLGTTILQKQHQPWMESTSTYNENKAILLLRNPVDMIVAYRNFNFAGKLNRALSHRFQGFLWHMHINRALNLWVIHATSWLCRPIRLKMDKLLLHVTHYEDILADTERG